jgi:hypothetical protein
MEGLDYCRFATRAGRNDREDPTGATLEAGAWHGCLVAWRPDDPGLVSPSCSLGIQTNRSRSTMAMVAVSPQLKSSLAHRTGKQAAAAIYPQA